MNKVCVYLNEEEVKAIKTALKKQWLSMTDDNGNALNPKFQEFSESVYKTSQKFYEIYNQIKE